MTEEKSSFLKIAVKPEIKREIDIVAAQEQRHVYEVVDDMLKLYKASTAGQPPSPKSEKKSPNAESETPEPVAA